MTEQLSDLVAERFRALGDPTRIRLLDALRQRERSVTELVDATGATQANVSKHLALLLRLGFVARRKEGNHTFYRVDDPDVFKLCDLVCGGARVSMQRQQKILRGAR